jgi:hypothetical protein
MFHTALKTKILIRIFRVAEGGNPAACHTAAALLRHPAMAKAEYFNLSELKEHAGHLVRSVLIV